MTVSALCITRSWSKAPSKHGQVCSHEEGVTCGLATHKATHRERESDNFGEARLPFPDALEHHSNF